MHWVRGAPGTECALGRGGWRGAPGKRCAGGGWREGRGRKSGGKDAWPSPHTPLTHALGEAAHVIMAVPHWVSTAASVGRGGGEKEEEWEWEVRVVSSLHTMPIPAAQTLLSARLEAASASPCACDLPGERSKTWERSEVAGLSRAFPHTHTPSPYSKPVKTQQAKYWRAGEEGGRRFMAATAPPPPAAVEVAPLPKPHKA